MSKYIDDLIFDRTAQDLRDLTDKAYIDYRDLNRVETAVKWISHVLNKYGYHNVTHNKTRWQINEWRTEADMVRLRKNIEAIRKAYYTESDTPLTPGRITYTSIFQANAIEKILYDLGNLIEKSFPGPYRLSFKLGTKTLGNRSIII